MRHRVANFDWDDDWVFSDPRFQLADGPDQVLLDFLALMAHPLVQPDTEQAARLVAALNVLLAPDGWELRTGSFMSGRPVYSASRAVSGPARMIRLEIGDDDVGKLDIVLGQAHHLLGESGDAMAQGLIAGATLALRRDGGYFHPIPDDNWTSATYEAVLTVAPEAAPEFTPDIESRVWSALDAVLAHHGRDDVVALAIARATAPLPAVSADWRLKAADARQSPTNQARRERAGRRVPVPGRPHLRQPGRARRLQRPGGTPAGFPRQKRLRRATAARRQAPRHGRAHPGLRGHRQRARRSHRGRRAAPLRQESQSRRRRPRPALETVRRRHNPHRQRARQRPQEPQSPPRGRAQARPASDLGPFDTAHREAPVTWTGASRFRSGRFLSAVFIALPAPGIAQGAGDALVGGVGLPVDAVGVDLEQDRDAVPGAGGRPRSRAPRRSATARPRHAAGRRGGGRAATGTAPA